MFLNANVLFKTKLIDGVSTVNRFAQTKVANKEKSTSGRNNNQELMCN
jgi:hypothetical protein